MSLLAGWGFLSRSRKARDRYAFNILRGTYHDQPLFIFDYHYQTGSGKNTQDHWSHNVHAHGQRKLFRN